MKYGGPERRKHPRLPMSARVRLFDSGKIYYMIAQDISIGGIGVTFEDSLDVGEELEIDVAISGVDKLIKAYGKVVRKMADKPDSWGIEFMRFKPHSKSHLKKTLARLVKA